MGEFKTVARHQKFSRVPEQLLMLMEILLRFGTSVEIFLHFKMFARIVAVRSVKANSKGT